MEELINQIREAMKASLRTIEWGKIPYQPITLCRLLEGLLSKFSPLTNEISSEIYTTIENGQISRIANLRAVLSEVDLIVKFINKDGKIDIEVIIKNASGEPLYSFNGYEKYKSFERESSDLSLLRQIICSINEENYLKVLELKNRNKLSKTINNLADNYISLYNSVKNVEH